MGDFVQLDRAIRRSIQLAAGICLVLLLLTGAAFYFAASAVWRSRETVERMPVLVVPGAVAGTYSPGLTEDNVRAAARYLTGLGTSFSGLHGMDQRFDEMEAFASPDFLPLLQTARQLLRRDVETQNQARAFFGSPGSERLAQTAPGHFEYALHGERIVYASGLPMNSRQATVKLKLLLGSPSERNRVGIMLNGFEVTDDPSQSTPSKSQ